MGDKIRAVIEAMAWDLRALEKKGVFTAEEVKTIVKTREDWEYRINKNTARDYEFLEAIQYELELVIPPS